MVRGRTRGVADERHTGPLDIDEIDVMGCGVDHGPESHRIGDLPVEPDVLIGREEPAQFRADEANNVAQHRNEDQASVESENKTGATRSPDGPLEAVETSEPSIGILSFFVSFEDGGAMTGIHAPGNTNHIQRRRNASRRR